MALLTFGTAATTTLAAIKFNHSSGALSDSDLALLNASIKPAVNATYGNKIGQLGTYLTREGVLQIPGRGFLKVGNGDYIATDPATGWPILLSAGAAAGASYVHS